MTDPSVSKSNGPGGAAPVNPESVWTISRVATISAVVLGGAIAVLFLIGIGLALFSNVEATAPRLQIIRDIFIIIMALEFILIIGALTILILQIARLINLLQNEIKPVLENTQDAVNSAKGTVEFVGSNLTEPLIRVGAFFAGATLLFREVGGIRRAIRRNPSKEQPNGTNES